MGDDPKCLEIMFTGGADILYDEEPAEDTEIQ